jgi:hypothetical protein
LKLAIDVSTKFFWAHHLVNRICFAPQQSQGAAIKRWNNIAADAFLLNLPVVAARAYVSVGKSITHLWRIRRR